MTPRSPSPGRGPLQVAARRRRRLAGEDLPALAARLLDPAIATGTLHWGRNYIYRATLTADAGVARRRGQAVSRRRARADGAPAAGARRQGCEELPARPGLRRRRPPHRRAVALRRERRRRDRDLRHAAALDGFTELRYLLRARNAGLDEGQFPGLDVGRVVEEVAPSRAADARRRLLASRLLDREPADPAGRGSGRSARAPPPRPQSRAAARGGPGRGADARSLPPAARSRRRPRAAAVDLLRRRRADRRLGALRARPPRLPAQERDQGRAPAAPTRSCGAGSCRAARTPTSRRRPRRPRRATRSSGTRLSDQPHSHASRAASAARVRLADAPSHLRVGSPRSPAQCRASAVGTASSSASAIGAVRLAGARRRASAPGRRTPDALLAAFDELGARRALLRLHPWAGATTTTKRRWRARFASAASSSPSRCRRTATWCGPGALARRGRRDRRALPPVRPPFPDRSGDQPQQVGRLEPRRVPRARRRRRRDPPPAASGDRAVGALRAGGDRLRGPRDGGDRQSPAATVGDSALRFDGLASLLYVDRRGAPENRQLGFDTEDKVRAARGDRRHRRGWSTPARQWIPEVNWPLREGPHSPAGKSVSVDEEAQADYLVRYFLLAAGTGLVERIDWWQLIAKGYGLVDPASRTERSAGAPLSTLSRRCAASSRERPAKVRRRLGDGVRAIRFVHGGKELLAAWAPEGVVMATPPRPIVAAVGRDGKPRPASPGPPRLTGAVAYLRLD